MRRWVVVGGVAAGLIAIVVVVLALRSRDAGRDVRRTADRVVAPPGWRLIATQDKDDAVLGQCVASSGCVQSIRTWLADVSPDAFVADGTAMLAQAGVRVRESAPCRFRPNVQPAARDCALTGETSDAAVTLRWRHPEYAEEVVDTEPVDGRALVTLTVEPS